MNLPTSKTPTMPDRFSEWVIGHRGGEFDLETWTMMAKLVQAVKETNKAGSMMITLKVAPTGNTVTVTDTHAVKVPVPTKPTQVYFSDEYGRLGKHDPSQYTLDIPAEAAKEIVQ